SELFGYVKGAFTGATQNKRGLFEVAHGGTIFLDEISEMSLAMQVKLLRVLQERVLRPVGGTEEISIDVRVIAATNKDLAKMVTEGTFREDLYYRVSVIPIEVPPLRERRDDVPLLANHFLKKYAPAAGKSIVRLSPNAISALMEYQWPGNVRQLENTVERAVALESTNELRVEVPVVKSKAATAAAAAGQSASYAGGNGNGHSGTNGDGNGNGHYPGLPPVPQFIPVDGVDLERYIASFERALIQSALKQSNGVQTRAAEMLKVSYRSFRHLLKKYDI
ncbi:MAG TPA: sigma-54 dependent transcriptional regulator, partial [Terriglobales bacterium]|nr:sigma-54 dependent transcriptional regulator [Terriglobales bacterium]